MTRKEYIDMMLSEYKITHIEGLSKISVTTNYKSNKYIGSNELVGFKVTMTGTENFILIITHGFTTKLKEQVIFVPYDRDSESRIVKWYHQEIEIWNEIMEKKHSLIY